MSIARDGYVFVPKCVDGSTLDVLREEADHLFRLKKVQDALSEDEYLDKGCALDFFTNNELSEGDGARTSVDAYMSRRNGALYRRARSNPTSPACCGVPEQPNKRAKHEEAKDMNAATGATDKNNSNEPAAPEKWSEQHVATAHSAIFATLARLAWDALKHERSLRQEPPAADSGSNPPLVVATSTSTISAEGGGDSEGSKNSDKPSPLPSQPNAVQGKPAARPVLLGATERTNGSTQQDSEADPPPMQTADDVDLRQRAGGNTHIGGSRGAGEAWNAAQGGGSGSGGGGDQGTTAAVTATASEADDGERPLLFNEQYVVKPPRSSIEFGWHTDEREQLAMCVFSPGIRPPGYVSVWLALDDCDAANGCLEVYPQSWGQPRRRAPSDEDEADVVCIPAKAGDAVVFLSSLWHRSGPNRTEEARRVFYAQYSCQVICATPSDPRPLSLAVPCSLSPLTSLTEHAGRPKPGSDVAKGSQAPEEAVDKLEVGLAEATGPARIVYGVEHVTPREDTVRRHVEVDRDRNDTLVVDGASNNKRARGLSTQLC